ncbi:MAG TPA: mechanosensitive ion channel domain-containing protein [Blastocatellia bacterium]|nr:mechanosensitive ion channel domain-containing protein [Blastocatellia bacterium]
MLSIFGSSVLERMFYYLNYPFINQAQYKVSLLSLILLVGVILIASMVSRYLRGLLEKRLLPRWNIEIGLQYTLLRVVHYLIIILGVLYALKLGLNVDLTSIAVILGFLSVGIGFGLQYVASDVASGFILLFERPVRVGDRIKIEDMEGRVETISLRATIVITNDNMAVVVPNSTLVRNKFTNFSHGSQNVRIRIPIGVAYGSDLKKVTDALIEAGKAVPEVLRTPPPRVNFKEFGDSSLNFELLVWINQPHKHPQIRSSVNYQIDRLFRQYGIEIPSPQRDLTVRSGYINVKLEDEAEIRRNRIERKNAS